MHRTTRRLPLLLLLSSLVGTTLQAAETSEAIGKHDSATTRPEPTQPLSNRILITEILANSGAQPDVEYVEILNSGPGPQDLTGWFLLDGDDEHDRCLLNGRLAPGAYRVVAGSIDSFRARFPAAGSSLNAQAFDSHVRGRGFSLGDAGDEIRLFRPGGSAGILVHGFQFGPQAEEIPFGYLPENADAPEYLTIPTPGQSNSKAAPLSPVCINEFLTTSEGGGVDDWIELYNRGPDAVEIGGWYLSDRLDRLRRFRIPPGTILPAGGYLVIDETELGFSMSSKGSEVIVLTQADGKSAQDFFDYGPQRPDVSRGRQPDGAPYWRFFTLPTPGASNLRQSGSESPGTDSRPGTRP